MDVPQDLQLSLRSGSEDNRLQKMTIFYNGHVSVSDVTDLQANAILEMVKKEVQVDEKQGGHKRKENNSESSPAPETRFLNSGQSMKRSLQRFLQKRKTRIADNSPYGFRKPLLQLFSS